MVKITLTCDEENMEMEGQCVVAFVIDPEGQEGANCATLTLGNGSRAHILTTTSVAMGTLLKSMVSNPFDQAMMAMALTEAFKESIDGEACDVREVLKHIMIKKKEEE